LGILASHDRDFLDRVVNGVLAPDGGGRWLEYAGGYTDMLTQRGEDIVRRPAAEAPKVPKRTRRRCASRSRSNEAELSREARPRNAAEINRSIAAKLRDLHQRLDDPSLYARRRQTFDETSAALTAAQIELAAAEEKWLELEVLREELEGE